MSEENLPRVGEVWIHRSGWECVVEGVSKGTVTFRDPLDGKEWTKPLPEFLGKMNRKKPKPRDYGRISYE